MATTTETELRTAERAAWGDPPARPGLQPLGFKSVRRNALRGFAEVRLPNQLIISDILVGEANGRQWALLPSKPMVDRDGNLRRDARQQDQRRPRCRVGHPRIAR